MKTRFSTFDIVCSLSELQKLVGMRVNNIYDIDNKTYLIRLQKSEEKCVLLLESGNRFHSTGFEWPKNVAPSGFSMKMRKHLKNKRLECLRQLGCDRIVDLQFGSGEAAYHLILELYDKGNVILTDYELTILYVLRPHTEGDRIKFVVREKYPQDRARTCGAPSEEQLREIFEKAKTGDAVKKVLLPHLEYGPALLEHVLVKHGFTNGSKVGKTFDITKDIDRLIEAIKEADQIMESAKKQTAKGYIIQKKEERPNQDQSSDKEYFYSNQEFHPMLFQQHTDLPHIEFDSFNTAVDEFFSTLESQKLELRALQQEREAMKKLENVRKDHDQRLHALEKTQEVDKEKAELITRNQQLVDSAILAVQTALANQISWSDIAELLKSAAEKGDPIAQRIKQLKLETNHISLFLTDPFAEAPDSSDSEQDSDGSDLPSMVVDIDLDLTAFANARKYYDQKRSAAKKQQKTIESHSKALKSAEKKTKQTLKEVQTIKNINKARKVYWFEKFFWFISSENYLVIAGRDQQQNELIVKRYLKASDVYVHADIHGASSVVIKNPTGQPVPPKTLNEAGTMAICYSVAWEAKVVTNAYWVMGDQVSKTAPTGEYLTTGSFMVRGKKNFLPPSHLVLGLSFLFRVEDGSIERHKNERRVIAGGEDEVLSTAENEEGKEDVEIELQDSDDDDKEETKPELQNLSEIKEETGEEEEEPGESKNQENEDNESSGDSSDNESKFPDTQIKIQHFEGTKINVIAKPQRSTVDEENEEQVVYLGDDKPVVLKQGQRSRGSSESKVKFSRSNSEVSSKSQQKSEEAKQQQPKRGQKSKLKKIKKYKDQDEEERKLRMEILQSAGSGKEAKKIKKNKDGQNTKGNKKGIIRIPKPQMPKKDVDEDGGDDDETNVQADIDMIDALTGNPLPEDELLFAVPVVAPYNTLANYKFKVKLTPGTGKRGKAAKTAVSMFTKDRAASQREKDLLRAVRDEQLARNLPGKVKLSAPKLQAYRK